MIQVCLSGVRPARFAIDAASCRQAVYPMRWRLMFVWCLAVSLPAPLVLAQAPSASREELMRKWDLDRDGKVDASEAEIARSRMRRARTDAMLNSGTDPVTGRPRVPTDPVTGRPMPRTAADNPSGIPGQIPGGAADPADDDGLILLPGTGAGAGGPGNTAARQPAARSSQSEREALPGTRVPALGPTLPSLAPRMPGAASGSSGVAAEAGAGTRLPTSPSTRGLGSGQASGQGSGNGPDPTGRELSSRARILPNAPRGQNPAGRDPQLQAGAQQPGGRPGVIAGGTRPRVAGAAGATGTFGGRPGYGGGGPPTDLNAGRLPAGLPQSRGTAPGAAAGGRSGLPAQTAPGQSAFRNGMGTPRGSTAMPTPSTGMPTTSPRPGLRQPDAGRRQSQAPPRPPRVTSDDFYGR